MKEINTERNLLGKHKTYLIDQIKKNIEKNEENNNLKGGNPNDVHMSGKKLIEQAFQNDKDPQEANTKFFCQLEKL